MSTLTALTPIALFYMAIGLFVLGGWLAFCVSRKPDYVAQIPFLDTDWIGRTGMVLVALAAACVVGIVACLLGWRPFN